MSFSASLYPVTTLTDLMDIQGGAQPPAKTFKDRPEDGYVRFVQIRDFETDAHLTYIQALPKWRYCTEQDVLIARYGASVGRICRGVAGAYNVALAKVMPKDVDLDFLYHLLRTRFFQDPLAAMSGRSAQAGFNKEDLAAIKVPNPSLDDQRRIVATLNCLDERIALLRETNATLEAIAQALFKSWFVDFDPVHAKMEGRTPEGMDEATAALFPDSFEESELGLLPMGWRVSSIYEVAKVTYGAPFASKLFKAEPPGMPLVRIRDLKDERPGVFTEERHPKGYVLQPGDIVVGMDGEFRAYLWGGDEAWLNQRVCAFHPINGASAAFVRLCISPLLAAVEATETATTVIHLGKNDIDRFRVVIPSQVVLDLFSKVSIPLYERIVKNKQKAQTLANLRDTLLPRLISGQLRLSEAEAVI